MTSTILATFDTLEHANNAIHELTDSGFKRNDIGLAVYDANNQLKDHHDQDVTASEGGSFGAKTGAILGALVGLGAITIPGIGPVIAAGPLAIAIGAFTGAGIGAVSGGVTGGITAALLDFGVSKADVDYYAESLKRGAALVSVTAHEVDADRAYSILNNHKPIDIDKRVVQWRKRGWTGFDPKVDPYTAKELAEMREEYTSEYTLDEDAELHDEDEYYEGARRYPLG